MKSKFLVVTKGLAIIREAENEKAVLKEKNYLKKRGYKQPMVYRYVQQYSKKG